VNRVMYLRVPLKALNFLTSLATLSLSGMSVLHCVASFDIVIHKDARRNLFSHYKLHYYFCVTYFY
jgi:hypothetical protein